ncbi:DinB family protein [Gramella sp. GC03-9]|uniref:DinB family protein n=1 Tax=Christiangramia oceanisediminis TaxID=2920386 RepID=A0A9X2KZI7_9FLAO|nr:DinB family protein [Gramella oceanisediminis]MCP9201104.1 DinB family protein [Gramella oceanisediminis]
MSTEKQRREQLVKHLNGGMAFQSIDNFVDNLNLEQVGTRPDDLPYSFYEIFYHMHFAQKDILDYCFSEKYTEHKWPDDYWPDSQEPESEESWEELKSEYFQDREKLQDYILDLENDIDKPVKNSEKHSLFREILLIIEHNAYHTGQLLVIQRLLGAY